MALTITFDLEDNRRESTQEERFVAMSHRFLDFVEERGIVATVFVVGDLARGHRDLLRRVAAGGHEVGLHGLHHVSLLKCDPASLEAQLREGRELLEDAVQAPVRGFRAPIFSLTPASRWAAEKVVDAGFAYSSSVLPASNPLHGWPGAPLEPCRWDNGLIELPCPIGGIGRARIPFLGGIYLRYVPRPLLGALLARLPAAAVPWSYLHPYDLDVEEPFFVLPHAGWLTSRLVHTRRHLTLSRLDAALAAAGGAGRPLGEIAGTIATHELPTIG